MRNDALAANPGGLEVDPAGLLTQYRSGVPVEQLLIRPEGLISVVPREHSLS